MKLTIKSLYLENFKGVIRDIYNLKDCAEIVGANGTGKTTIATAWYWLMINRDYNLKSNPNVYPVGDYKCMPRVRAVVDVDGKEYVFEKYQKRTVKESKSTGLEVVTITSKYTINEIEYGEREFEKKLAEIGIDISLFAALSHIEAFTGQKALEMRNALGKIATEISDKEILSDCVGFNEIKPMLDSYTLDEIEKMYSQKLKNSFEAHGKYASKIVDRIEAKHSIISDVELSDLELQKSALTERIAEIRKKIEELSETDRNNYGVEIIRLHCELNDLERKANEENNKKRYQLEEIIRECNMTIDINRQHIAKATYTVNSYNHDLQVAENEISNTKNEIASIEEEKKHEVGDTCPECGQKLPLELARKIKEKYWSVLDEKKRAFLERIENLYELNAETYIKTQELKSNIEECEKHIDKASAKLEKARADLNALPTHIDVSSTDEYKSIKSEIERLTEESKNNHSDEIEKLKAEKFDLEEQLTEVNSNIGMALLNDKINEQIEELCRQKKAILKEQTDFERILFEVKEAKQCKNGKIEEDINKCFKLVNFRLFETLKNGETKECCMALHNRKKLGEDTNTALEMLMKFDIINGLQKAYDMFLPVFIDEGEKITDNSRELLKSNCQTIYLTVKANTKLTIMED